jgi:hypothetical protein
LMTSTETVHPSLRSTVASPRQRRARRPRAGPPRAPPRSGSSARSSGRAGRAARRRRDHRARPGRPHRCFPPAAGEVVRIRPDPGRRSAGPHVAICICIFCDILKADA